MLRTLNIENIAVIEKAKIEFNSGLNVLTGETGAGKSIVVDSINAILGERTSRELVRHGAASAFVSALFTDVNRVVNQKLEEFGIDAEEDNTLLLTRKISADLPLILHTDLPSALIFLVRRSVLSSSASIPNSSSF